MPWIGPPPFPMWSNFQRKCQIETFWTSLCPQNFHSMHANNFHSDGKWIVEMRNFSKNLLAELYNSRLVPTRDVRCIQSIWSNFLNDLSASKIITNCTNGQMKRFSLPFPIPPDNLEGRGGWTSQYLPRFDGARIQCAHCPMCTMCTGLASVKVSPKERDNLVQFNFVRKCLLILHGGRR